VHRYFEIDTAIVWRIVEVNVPKLRQEVQALFDRHEQASATESC